MYKCETSNEMRAVEIEIELWIKKHAVVIKIELCWPRPVNEILEVPYFYLHNVINTPGIAYKYVLTRSVEVIDYNKPVGHHVQHRQENNPHEISEV